MKYKFTLFIAAVIIVNVSYSQIKIGCEVGLNQSNLNLTSPTLSFTVLGSYKGLTGSYAGVVSQIHLAKKFSARVEIYYSAQGSKVKYSNSSLKYDKFKFDYLNLPLLFKYHPFSHFNFVTGPQFGFLLSTKQKIPGFPLIISRPYYFKSNDFCWDFGVGYEISSINLEINARYCMGVSNNHSSRQEYTNYFDYENIKNKVFQFGLSYYIFSSRNRRHR